MLLLLIRHGLTPKTGVRLSGWTPGVHLSKDGRAQAERLVERFEGVRLDAMYCSPLERTRETAEPLAAARGIEIQQRADVGEVRYGAIENKPLKMLAKSEMWKHLQGWPSNVRFPGGESLRETQARAVSAIEELRDLHAKDTIAVFSHGDWIRLSLAHFMGVHIDMYRRLAIETASVSAIYISEWGPIIRLVNDTGSLGHLTPPRDPSASKATPKKKTQPRKRT
jgi:probable phosphomutase (TIGR03848 family)